MFIRKSNAHLSCNVSKAKFGHTNASGHVGIIVNNHQNVSADSAVLCYAPPTPKGTITNTDYGFRPDNYFDPTLCRTHGLKRYAVVKRFFGQ
jgi:hypothetical protein